VSAPFALLIGLSLAFAALGAWVELALIRADDASRAALHKEAR
jgi:hypothetical protein